MSKKKPAPNYMFLFRQPAGGPEPTPEQMQAIMGQWMKWIGKLTKSGHYLGGEPLEDNIGKVLRGPRGGKVSDGPFAEAKEVVGGYFLIRAKSLAEAARLAKGSPIYDCGGNVEVRQIMPM